MDTQRLLPISAHFDTQSDLLINQQSVIALAERYGTPLYVYDQATLEDGVARYTETLAQHWQGEWQVAYAAKAWLNTTLAQWAAERGLGMDVVSEGELRHARHAGFPAARIHAHGNNKSDSFLQTCVAEGVGRIVIDHIREAERLTAICAKRGVSQSVWIRINPATAAPTHTSIETGSRTSKFGASIEDGAAEQIVRFLMRDDVPLTLQGIHFHIGSQIADTAPYVEATNRTLAWVAEMRGTTGWELREFSPGGGWAVPYTPSAPYLDPCDAIPVLCDAIKEACNAYSTPIPLVVLEPGRELVARAGVAVYRVGAIKQAGDVTYVFIDGGLADNPRPSLYGSPYHAFVVPTNTPPSDTQEMRRYRIAGPFCESGDVLIPEIDLPPVQEDDLLVVPVSGAYQLSMASHYNGTPYPTVLWLHEGTVKVAQQRENWDRLWAIE